MSQHTPTPQIGSERGAAALVVAISMLVLMGFAALVVDMGAGFNERAQDQSAADAAVLAGTLDAEFGVEAMRDRVIEYVGFNLPTPTDGWQSHWETCLDPDGQANGFAPVPAPTGWAVTELECISTNGTLGLLRVRIPNQVVETTFARVMGFSSIDVSAFAEGKYRTRGAADIRPFGLPVNTPQGEQVCLSQAPTGLSDDPCAGNTSGDFGVIKARLFGNSDLGTTRDCNVSPINPSLAINIAVGIDHTITLHPTGVGPGELDDCKNKDPIEALPQDVDTLNMQQGFPSGVEMGLAVGPIGVAGVQPLLRQGHVPIKIDTNTTLDDSGIVSGSTTEDVVGIALDTVPLWIYIDGTIPIVEPNPLDPTDYTPQSTKMPAVCRRDSFTAPNSIKSDYSGGFPSWWLDWNADGTPDKNDGPTWQHLQDCLRLLVAGTWAPILQPEVAVSPRFGYVPELWHAAGAGSFDGPNWDNIRLFRAMWIQGTWWKKGNTWVVFHPGECGTPSSCTGSGNGNWQMKQVTGFVIPDAALPVSLRGDPPPIGGVDPYGAELYR